MIRARDLALLPAFATVVRQGSFTAAARELRLTKSVVSDQVRALEESLGEAEELASAAQKSHQRPTGTLRVTAPHDLAVTVVAAAFESLGRAHPELRFEIVSSDAPRDLVGESIDVALRLGIVRQPGMVVRRLASEPEIIVAAGRLAERHGGATRPSALAGLPWVVHRGLDFGSTWKFRSASGAADAIAVEPRALVDSMAGLRQLVLGELGAAVLPRHAVREDLAAGRLQQLCSGWHHRVLTLHAVLPHRQSPPRTRAFLAVLAPLLAAHGFGREPA